MSTIYAISEITPTAEDFEKIISGKLSYENAQQKSKEDYEAWLNNPKNKYECTPFGIAYSVSQKCYDNTVTRYSQKNWKVPKPYSDKAIKYFIVAIAIGWQELVDQLKLTLRWWGYTTKVLQQYADAIKSEENLKIIAQELNKANNSGKIALKEAVEKHETLNSKLFTKEELLKDRVRDKMLEIVDEFLADLKEQDIKVKVDDILFIGSNASYNYTKDSDIDLHILTNTSATNYSKEVAAALYGAYRTIFNKQLDIKLFDIPLEIFVETEESQRVSNGVYSVKKNKWIKKPVHENIPEYDKEALDELFSKWEDKCKKLIDDIKADKLDDEIKVVKMIEDIYEKLRKKGIAKGEYSVENLAFKELRNNGYLDQLKDYRNELVSKRLSLEERLDARRRADIYNQIAQACGTTPVIQDNGMFFIYNVKASELSAKVQALRKLPFISEVSSNESGKYDFSQMMQTQLPTKYYNIRGKINE